MDGTRAASPLRVAVVGLGFGAVHVQAFRADPRCTVVALCGRDRQRTQAMAEQLQVPQAVVDYRQLLEAGQIDVVALAVPAPQQVEIGGAALSAGRHVLFEKPLATDLAAARDLERLAARQRCATAVNFEFAEVPAWREVKRILDAGELGDVWHAAVTWRVETYANQHRIDGWKARSAEGGGVLNLFTSHSLYYLEWLFGPLQSLSATLCASAGDARRGDTFNAISAVTRRGIPIALSLSSDAFMGPGHRLEIYGSAATLVLDNPGKDYMKGFRVFIAQRGQASALREIDVPALAGDSQDGRVAATQPIARRLLDAVRGGPPALPGIRDGVRVQELMDAARLSSQTGTTQTLPLPEHPRSR